MPAPLADDDAVTRRVESLTAARWRFLDFGLARPHGASPDLDPIKEASLPIEDRLEIHRNAFAKPKALPRKAAAPAERAFRTSIGLLVALVTPDECANMSAAAGRDADGSANVPIEAALR